MKRGSLILLFACILFVISCNSSNNETPGAVYVKPSVDYKGKYRKGHVRFKVSTKKNAVKSQNSSKYYYQTKGKYRRKK